QQPEAAAAEAGVAAYGGGVIAKLEEQWRKTKEHAETYPYVWGSYILVYGGLAAYLTWRWCKLRRTEDRVRGLQARLRQLAAAEESQAASTPPPPPQQPPLSGPGKPTSGP
ncbi:Os01g0861000, partial [Oryza sativa Japonica Group]